jgi:hypothetical protein
MSSELEAFYDAFVGDIKWVPDIFFEDGCLKYIYEFDVRDSYIGALEAAVEEGFVDRYTVKLEMGPKVLIHVFFSEDGKKLIAMKDL